MLFLDIVLFRITGEHQRERTVAGNVTSSTEGILQREDGEHKRCTSIVESQNAGDQAERSHNRTAGNAGCTDRKDAEQCAEQNHGAKAGQRAIQDFGNNHDAEPWTSSRSAVQQPA